MNRSFRIPILLLGLLSSIMIVAQEDPYSQWDTLTLQRANTAKDIDYLSAEEKKVVFFVNLARMNGPLFVQTFLPHFTDSIKRKEDSWSKSLKKELKKLAPLEPLNPKDDLSKEASKHAKDMGKSGKMGHSSSKGKRYPKRMENLGTIYNDLAENCQYGYLSALAIVADLLIDEGIKTLGHRKNILNPNTRFIGVSIKSHKKFRVNCVMEFASSLK